MKNNLTKIGTGFLLSFIFITGLLANAQEKIGGLALYTVREEMTADPVKTLQAVADAGYKNIEAAGYANGKFYNFSPKEFKKLVKQLGLKPISTHQPTLTLDNADAMIADVKAAGFKYLVIPVPPMGLFKSDIKNNTRSMTGTPENLAEILMTLGKKCKKAGLQLLYHNHDFEFEKNDSGSLIYDYLLEHTDPKYVNFQMDLYWVTKAGADPISYFKKYPGRFKIWHVKDMDAQGRFAPIGTGTIDFNTILAHKKQAGMKYYMVEQDKTFDGMTPLEAIKISHAGLLKIGFK